MRVTAGSRAQRRAKQEPLQQPSPYYNRNVLNLLTSNWIVHAHCKLTASKRAQDKILTCVYNNYFVDV